MGPKALTPEGSAPSPSSRSYEESHMKDYDKGG